MASAVTAAVSTPAAENETVNLDLTHLQTLRVARHFTTRDVSYSKTSQQDDLSQIRGQTDTINCIDFFSDGSSLVSAHNNDVIKVYDCISGR